MRLGFREALIPCLLMFAANQAFAEDEKTDFRGVRLGMTSAQAETAAKANDGACFGHFPGDKQNVTCKFGDDADVSLMYTRKNRIMGMSVTLKGEFNDQDITKDLIKAYGLTQDGGEDSKYKNRNGVVFYLKNLGPNYSITIYDFDIMNVDANEPHTITPRL